MSSSTSSVRAFVQWTEQTVFAGEEIECQITFKNISPTHNASHSPSHTTTSNGLVPGGKRQRKTQVSESSLAPIKNSNQSTRTRGSSRGHHRSTLSLNFLSSSGRQQRGGGVVGKGSAENWESGRDGRSHQRSVSIISLGLSDHGRHEAPSQLSVSDSLRRPLRGHARSSSLQITPRQPVVNGIGPTLAPVPQRSTAHSSPLFHTVSDSNNQILRLGVGSREYTGSHKQLPIARSVPSTPSTGAQPFTARKPSSPFPQNFKFPSSTISPDQISLEDGVYDEETVFLHDSHTSNKLATLQLKQDVPVVKDRVRPLTKTISPTIHGETPRNSADFYSLSNNSTETLASEYVPQQGRSQQYQVHSRRMSNHADLNKQRTPETLMMGYAQVHGSFTLDGSLVNQAPFEEVKRKAVVGGQGGGVIGVGSSRRDTGLLRGFGWSDIGNSIGGLIGGGELSSIKDMRGIASSRSVPLLTTPQSILFVDLKLAPGESKSYQYAIRLPGGLPPSYRGKAIKISYNLVIGTQRPGGAMEQQVRSVEVPFRVLGSVNRHGQLLGHDFMSPYIIMRDQAKTQCLDNTASGSIASLQTRKIPKFSDQSQSDLQDFRTYVDDLLARPRQRSGVGLLSPTEGRASRRQSLLAGPSSAKESIDLAILRSNRATDSQQSANRFEIARNGQRVAVVILTRPAYRLGETITAAVDFTGADVSCYALHASLETSERINGAIALRSNASIHRVTRRIYSSCSESTLFARRMIFSCNIPSTATPSFITSGISLEWCISLEFVTTRLDSLEQNSPVCGMELLEEVSKDDRNIIYNAVEDMGCESFDVAIPLQIYGASTGSMEQENNHNGLVV